MGTHDVTGTLSWVGRGAAAVLAATFGLAVTTGASAPDVAGAVASGAASTGPQLGGFVLSAAGAGLRITYEQPNLPVPAQPSLEADLGYSSATDQTGPSGQAVASVLYPGQVAASAGSQLGAIIPGAPALPAWPVQAHSNYPQGPATANSDKGPATMEASSGGSGSSARSSYGTPSAASGTPALPSGMVEVGSITSTSSASAPGAADAASSSKVGQIVIAGGMFSATAVTSAATATSDGKRASLGGSCLVSGAEVAGQPVDVTSSGVTAAGHSVPIGLTGLGPGALLSAVGIDVQLAKPADQLSGATGSRQSSCLVVSVNLDKFDAALATLVAKLPSQISTEIYSLPLPLPNEQTFSVLFGWNDVSAGASPAYVPPAGGGTPPPRRPPPHRGGGGGTSHGGGIPSGGSTGQPSSGGGSTQPPASTGSATGSQPSVSNALPPASSSRPTHTPGVTTGVLPPLTMTGASVPTFKGIGEGLVAAAAGAALAVGWGSLWAVRKFRTVAAECPDEPGTGT